MAQMTGGSEVRRVLGAVSWRTMVGIGVVVAVGSVVAVWQGRGSSSATASVPTATAVRGDLVVSVRALGKVVDARAASRAVAPTGQAALVAAGTSQLILPQAAGRVMTVLVAPGQHVVAAQVLARLDPANAHGNLLSAQASLDQAATQLEVDRSGVTPQTLASARAAVTSAEATLAGAKAALRHTVRVNRDSVAAAEQQVAQANSGPRSTAAGIQAARDGLTGARTALADVQATNGQRIVTAKHAVESASQDLAADQTRLTRDLATEHRLCGINSPIITADTSSDCANAAAVVASDQQAIVKDQGVSRAAADTLAQVEVDAAQSEHQARAQITSAIGSVKSAQDQLAALRKATRQALATARSALAQARSKAAEATGQGQGQVTAASVGLANANAASVALAQGAPGPLLTQDRSKIEVARSQVLAARSALAQTIVRAPAAGTVTAVFVAPGSPVDLTTPLVAMADLAHLAVSADLSEFDAARIRAGLTADISIDALGGKRYPGRVVFEAISGVDNGGVVTFPVRISLGHTAGIRIGMNVSARIIVARRREVVTVPLEAVSRDGRGRAVVTIVDGTGKTSARVVSLGLANNKDVEITHGLRAGERVELQTSGGA